MSVGVGALYQRGLDATISWEHETRYHNAWEYFINGYIKWLSAHIGQSFETNGLFRESSNPEPPESYACHEYYEPDLRERIRMRKASRTEQCRLEEEERESQIKRCEESATGPARERLPASSASFLTYSFAFSMK